MRSYESRRFKHQRKTIYVGMMVGEISDIFWLTNLTILYIILLYYINSVVLGFLASSVGISVVFAEVCSGTTHAAMSFLLTL